MLRTIIIEDEISCTEALCKLLEKHCPQVNVLATCTSVAEAKEAIDKHKPDLIFLDVEMPDSNGFDLLMQTFEIHFEVIFTTDYDEYAVKAIKFSELDFLLKPLNEEEVRDAVAKAEKKVNISHQRQMIDTLLHNISYMNSDKKIALPTMHGMEFVSVKDIIRCEAENYYTVFYLVNKAKIMVSKTLGEYEELLSEYHFLRVHQSHLINLRFIKHYEKGEGGTVTMMDNSIVDISRRRKEEFLRNITKV